MANSETRCSVCFDSVQTEALCINLHQFCRACVFEWLEKGREVVAGPHGNDQSKKPTCPLCRQDLPNPDDYHWGRPIAQTMFKIGPTGAHSFTMWETSECGVADYVVTVGVKLRRGVTGGSSNDHGNPAISYPRLPGPPSKPQDAFTIAINMRLNQGDEPQQRITSVTGPQNEHPLYSLGDQWEVISHQFGRMKAAPQQPVSRPELGDVVEYNVKEYEVERDGETEDAVRMTSHTIGKVYTNRRDLALAVADVATMISWGNSPPPRVYEKIQDVPRSGTSGLFYMVLNARPPPAATQSPSAGSSSGSSVLDTSNGPSAAQNLD
jgi:hypothetical protein